MKKIKVIIICISLIMTSFISQSVLGNISVNNYESGNILYVGGTGDGNYTKIQEAIDNANPGDTIYVKPGIYKENIVITKSITLQGENKVDTIIDGTEKASTIHIKTSSVVIKGFTIIECKKEGGFCAGILVRDLVNKITTLINDITISDCIIKNNGVGIKLRHVSNFEISNCELYKNEDHSIYLIRSTNGNIGNCNAYNNGRILNPTSFVSGGFVCSVETDCPDMKCHDITISYCNIHDNVGFGLELLSSLDFIIFRNNFYRNNPNAHDYYSNSQWFNDITGEGNYWDDYEGYDINPKDGIGDTPYSRRGVIDNYPRMDHYGKPKNKINNFKTFNILNIIIDQIRLTSHLEKYLKIFNV